MPKVQENYINKHFAHTPVAQDSNHLKMPEIEEEFNVDAKTKAYRNSFKSNHSRR